MEKYLKKLDRLLRKEFPGSKTELEYIEWADRVSGVLIWKGFDRKEQVDRQSKLWKVLREKLTEQEQDRISAIVTVTPREMAVMREG